MSNNDSTSQDEQIVCTISRKASANDQEEGTNVGFVFLPSDCCTFLQLRESMQDQLVPDTLQVGAQWRFFIPKLGMVTPKQESMLRVSIYGEVSNDAALPEGIKGYSVFIVFQHTST